MIGREANESGWIQELKLLYDLDVKERKEYANFLMSKGYIPGTYIQNWQELVEEYQIKNNRSYQPGDRIFGDSFRDFRIRKLVKEHAADAIHESELRFKMFCLVKQLDQDKDTQTYFLKKLKKINNCEEIIKNLEERININDHKPLKTKVLV
jgi:hypothetical protein